MRYIWLMVLAFVLGSNMAIAHEITSEGRIEFRGGEIEIVDGDTVWIDIHEIRLHGIDTVETDQQCLDDGVNVGCHELTLDALREFTSAPDFHCEGHIGKDEKPKTNRGRYVATCYVGGIEVNRALVESGWAFAANTVDARELYGAAQTEAESAGIGLHAFDNVQEPWEFRRAKRKPAECTC
ncbi:MAG: thermonuclease family protein [Hyphomonadaceae bacterium]